MFHVGAGAEGGVGVAVVLQHDVVLPAFAGPAQGLAVGEVDPGPVVGERQVFQVGEGQLELLARRVDVTVHGDEPAPGEAEAGLCGASPPTGGQFLVRAEKGIDLAPTAGHHKGVGVHVGPEPEARFVDALPFRSKQRTDAADVDTELVDTLVAELLTAAHHIIRRHEVTYAEYDARKSWLIRFG
ncbi:hypothetical protein [Streptomyces sp. MBT62]|uniref:hypothetical protein n=1 Tax=Streptomyces sp. MBT62 TaxID=2800410 RepID=UPI0027DEAA7B|nr:hypothetical protein [Streptomyces sp. MBT62]